MESIVTLRRLVIHMSIKVSITRYIDFFKQCTYFFLLFLSLPDMKFSILILSQHFPYLEQRPRLRALLNAFLTLLIYILRLSESQE